MDLDSTEWMQWHLKEVFEMQPTVVTASDSKSDPFVQTYPARGASLWAAAQFITAQLVLLQGITKTKLLRNNKDSFPIHFH